MHYCIMFFLIIFSGAFVNLIRLGTLFLFANTEHLIVDIFSLFKISFSLLLKRRASHILVVKLNLFCPVLNMQLLQKKIVNVLLKLFY